MLIEPTIQAPLHRNYPIIDESSSSNSIAYAPNTFWIHKRQHQTEYAFHVRFHRLISIIGCTCKMIPESSGTSKPLHETHPLPPSHNSPVRATSLVYLHHSIAYFYCRRYRRQGFEFGQEVCLMKTIQANICFIETFKCFDAWGRRSRWSTAIHYICEYRSVAEQTCAASHDQPIISALSAPLRGSERCGYLFCWTTIPNAYTCVAHGTHKTLIIYSIEFHTREMILMGKRFAWAVAEETSYIYSWWLPPHRFRQPAWAHAHIRWILTPSFHPLTVRTGEWAWNADKVLCQINTKTGDADAENRRGYMWAWYKLGLFRNQKLSTMNVCEAWYHQLSICGQQQQSTSVLTAGVGV